MNDTILRRGTSLYSQAISVACPCGAIEMSLHCQQKKIRNIIITVIYLTKFSFFKLLYKPSDEKVFSFHNI